MKASPKKPSSREALTQEYLKELLSYDPISGKFTWRVDRNEQVRAGDIAGSFKQDGYRIIRIHSRTYSAHRLAFLYMLGNWPSEEIDHINHDRADNRWENLREATRQINTFNVSAKARPDNISGIKGIRKWKGNGKWHARITHNKKSYHLGYFDTQEEARTAYIDAAIALGRVVDLPPS